MKCTVVEAITPLRQMFLQFVEVTVLWLGSRPSESDENGEKRLRQDSSE
jgi:hypothetical protein